VKFSASTQPATNRGHRLWSAVRWANGGTDELADELDGFVAAEAQDVAMRALDCTDPSHDNMHITGEDHDDLTRQVEQHITDSHPELTTAQARTIVAEGAYDE
jgi:hypothetical protein